MPKHRPESSRCNPSSQAHGTRVRLRTSTLKRYPRLHFRSSKSPLVCERSEEAKKKQHEWAYRVGAVLRHSSSCRWNQKQREASFYWSRRFPLASRRAPNCVYINLIVSRSPLVAAPYLISFPRPHGDLALETRVQSISRSPLAPLTLVFVFFICFFPPFRLLIFPST